jgi:hypothetical protein
MTIGESLKRVVGKALRPVRAGDDDLAIERLGARSLPKIEVHSASFGDDHVIPARFTHSDGEDVSPALRWHGVPESAAELVVLCEDPDAPSSKPFVHWIAYGIAPVDGGLIEGVRAEPRADSGMMQGKNSMSADGYAARTRRAPLSLPDIRARPPSRSRAGSEPRPAGRGDARERDRGG